MKLFEFIKKANELIKKWLMESKITRSLSKQPIFFYVFIVAFLVIRYSLIYSNDTFVYKGVMILLYSVLAILLRNFATDIKVLLEEKATSKMSFVITAFYHLLQIGALVALFLFIK